MQRGLMSGWESWGEICTDRLRAAAFSSWPRPSGQLEKREAETTATDSSFKAAKVRIEM